MKILNFIVILFLIKIFHCFDKPKLIVEVVIDGMSLGQLERFWDNLSPYGIKRVAKNGVFYKNHRDQVLNVDTASMHATLSTGATPSIHGLIGNSWINKQTGMYEYGYSCPGYTTPAPESLPPLDVNAAGMCPDKIYGSTVADELIMQYPDSRVFAIARKDRAAIGMAGRRGIAYFYDEGKLFSLPEGGTILSTSYYMNSYPQWVQDFKNSMKVGGSRFDNYFGNNCPLWELTYPLEKYHNKNIPRSVMPAEMGYKSLDRTCTTPGCWFPKKLDWTSSTMSTRYANIGQGPAGDRLITDFAKELIVNEQLGKGSTPDILFLNYALDSINHANGAYVTLESEDAFYKIDYSLKEVFEKIEDQNLSFEDDVAVFITGDHGHQPTKDQMKWLGYKYAGIVDLYGEYGAVNSKLGAEAASWVVEINKKVRAQFPQIPTDPVPYVTKPKGNPAVWQTATDFANSDGIWLNLTAVPFDIVPAVENFIGEILLNHTEIEAVWTRHNLVANIYHDKWIGDSFHSERSPNVLYAPKHAMFNWSGLKMQFPNGAAHTGSLLNGDHLLPLIISRKNHHKEVVFTPTSATQIAPTLTTMLGVARPSGARDVPLQEFIKDYQMDY